jgi:hypothetical protein
MPKVDRKTQEISIKSGDLNDIVGEVLQERYLIGKLIYSGINSIIFTVNDLTKETQVKTKLIVKICKDSDDLTNEVITLLELRKI